MVQENPCLPDLGDFKSDHSWDWNAAGYWKYDIQEFSNRKQAAEYATLIQQKKGTYSGVDIVNIWSVMYPAKRNIGVGLTIDVYDTIFYVATKEMILKI